MIRCLLLCALAMNMGFAVRADDRSISEYESAVLDCPVTVSGHPDLVLFDGDGLRRISKRETAGPPDDFDTSFLGIDHYGTFVTLHDDWNLVCRYRTRDGLSTVTTEIPVQGYLVRIDFLDYGPANQNMMLRIWGTYLREKANAQPTGDTHPASHVAARWITKYESAALDCPLAIAARPDLVLVSGNARRRAPGEVAVKLSDGETHFRGVVHSGMVLPVFDDWSLVCVYRSEQPPGLNFTLHLPVPGYLIRVDLLEYRPAHGSSMLRLWGTYLRLEWRSRVIDDL